MARQLLKNLLLIALRSDKSNQNPLYASILPWVASVYLIKTVAAPPLALVAAVVVGFAGADPGA